MSSVVLQNVRKRFGPVEVIKGVDLDIAEGEFVTFVGQSGSGKSTLLRMIAGLEDVSDGSILIGDEDVTFEEPSDRGIAMVFQSYALYPHMDIYTNIAFNLRLAKMPKGEIDSRVRDAARILKLDALLDRSPAQLSGGQRQRVAIGRSIVRQPKVFLFDEPLSNLDAALRVQMRLEIEKLHRTLGATMIYVTHDQVEAMTLADRIVALEDGVIQQVAPPMEMYERPSNRFVAGFIGSPKMNFFAAEAVPQGDDRVEIRVEGHSDEPFALPLPGIDASRKVTLGLRPEEIGLDGGAGVSLHGRIETVERLGNITYVYLDLGLPDLVTIQRTGPVAHLGGEDVAMTFAADRLHVFDERGACLMNPQAPGATASGGTP